MFARSNPRVAALRQPWALGQNRFAVLAALSPARLSKLLAQLRLPEFAGRGARDRLEEFEAVGELPLREMGREVRTQIGRCRGLALLHYHAGQRTLAPF